MSFQERTASLLDLFDFQHLYGRNSSLSRRTQTFRAPSLSLNVRLTGYDESEGA